MRKTILILTATSLVLASCGWRDSRVNPRNWFGNSREAAQVQTGAEQEVNPLIPAGRRGVFAKPERPDTSVEIDTVTELRVEPTNTGAIVYAAGIAARQGAYGARLTPSNDDILPDENGVLSLSFRVNYPRRGSSTGSEFSRTVHEAFSLNKQQLERIRVIRVTAARNARETRRR